MGNTMEGYIKKKVDKVKSIFHKQFLTRYLIIDFRAAQVIMKHKKEDLNIHDSSRII